MGLTKMKIPKKPTYTFWTKPGTLGFILKTEFDAYPPYYAALGFGVLSILSIYPLWYWQYHKSMENASNYYKGGGSMKKMLPEENRSEYIDSVKRKMLYDKKRKSESIETKEL